MAIPINADFEQLTVWLNENLNDKKSIKACCQEVNKVPETKGIYFWFMKPEGYNTLSNYVSIKPLESKFVKEIDGVKYDLVYLGTAGTGKKGNSNLANRFEWHIIKPHHTEKNICSGFLSTLRAGLGSLLSDDLILPNTEIAVNDFMREYMRVFWIEYSDDKSLIDNDEKSLIKGIRPILNLKNNQNARANAIANTTQVYKIRRAEIYKKTRIRIGCNSESEESKKTNKLPTDNSPSFEHQVYSEENTCKEFFVLKNQSISEVVRGIDGLPKESCKFQIINSNTGLLVTEYKGWNKTGTKVQVNPKAQNIYTYFSATGGKIEGKETPRWIHIQNRMNKKDDEIEEITVKVCSSSNYNNEHTNNSGSQAVILKENAAKIEKLNLSKNLMVVMVCAGRKNNSFFTAFPNENFVNTPDNGVVNEHHPDDIMNNWEISWRDYLINNQNDNNLLEAYKLYKREEYRCLHRKYKNNFYILSAGWGLVNSEFKLPNYNITFSHTANQINKRNNNLIVPPVYNDFNDFTDVNKIPLVNPKEDILYIGGKDYLELFYDLTQDLPNRKIIFKFNNTDIPAPPNNSFLIISYLINYPSFWYYQLAKDLCNL